MRRNSQFNYIVVWKQGEGYRGVWTPRLVCAHFTGPFRATEAEARLDCKLDAQFGQSRADINPVVQDYDERVKENGAKTA